MRLERSDIKFPLWRKKVDSSLFHKIETPIPNWLAKIWSIEKIFGKNTLRKNPQSQVEIIFDKIKYEGWVTYVKYAETDTLYKLFFSKEFAEKLRDVFIMSYMRSLEQRLRGNNRTYRNNVEDDIPFWEFLDIEFDKSRKLFKCKAHYYQKPIFPELFKQFVRSHLLKEIENKLLDKGDFKFIKEDWKPRSEISLLLERRNIIYYLMDTKNKLLYIGESDHTKRITQQRKEIPQWDYYRMDCLPGWLDRGQRLELERLMIRSFASILINGKNIYSKKISEYKLVNKKIDI
jgi:hypothetical protein